MDRMKSFDFAESDDPKPEKFIADGRCKLPAVAKIARGIS
jgi:hypothetical protein